MQHRSSSRVVSLLKLQQALRMPLIEDWLGLLLGEQEQYQWKSSEEFYQDAAKLWLRKARNWSD